MMPVQKLFAWCILIILPMIITGQNFQLVQSLPMARIATYIPNQPGAISFAMNQASLARLKKFSAVICSERRFLLEELTQFSFLAAIPAGSGSFGIKLDRFGSGILNETQAGIAYGRNLTPVVSVGIQCNYFIKNVQSYPKQSAVFAEAGIIIHLSDQLRAGVHIYNPTSVQVGKAGEKLPSVYSTGLGYAPSDKFFLVADLRKMEDQPVNIHTGIHYSMVPGISVSAGITSAASSFYVAAGYKLNSFLVTASAGLHPFLGWSPGLMLSYNQEK